MHEKYEIRHKYSTQWHFVISDLLKLKVVKNIAGFKCFSTNVVVKFCNKKLCRWQHSQCSAQFQQNHSHYILENNSVFDYFVKMTKKLVTQVTTQICRQIMQQFTQIIIFSLNYILTVVQWKILPHPSNEKCFILTAVSSFINIIISSVLLLKDTYLQLLALVNNRLTATL